MARNPPAAPLTEPIRCPQLPRAVRPLRTSRFADVKAIATVTLTLGPDADAFYNLAWAQFSTGQPQHALENYNKALRLYHEADNRANEAAAVNNIGRVYDGLGDPQQALTHYHQALPIRREVGDREGEAVTRYNIAMIHRDEGISTRRSASLRSLSISTAK
ncbi:tetratricopeptide repeat protein [Micromonospora sp. DT229]|uniref:tetratricopeptide repeat protein n=1 Tax=Micromonospora sp. DT229 TaxID=3393430 RepID=UPI003CEED290